MVLAVRSLSSKRPDSSSGSSEAQSYASKIRNGQYTSDGLSQLCFRLMVWCVCGKQGERRITAEVSKQDGKVQLCQLR